jgi:asparagine synthase (glutamine-hydrolysing)
VDPFAEKPLYYCRREGRLLFASSIRALKAAEPEVGVADERAIEEFVALGTIPSLPRTFFADVSRMPPACVASWEGGKLSSRRYWTPRWVSVPDDPAVAAARLRELLLESIRLRLRSDVAVGTSLSGGVDSSAIVAACAHLAGGHVRHAFTATFPGFPRDEWTEAHAVSQAAGVVRHHAVAPCAEELLDDLPALVRDQEEPFISTSVYAQWRVMRAAREAGVVVLLDGQGADELFGGYLGTGSWALRAAGPRAALAALAMNPAIARDLAIAYTAGRVPRAVARQYRLRRASRYVTDAVARSAAEGELGREEWEGSPLRRELLSQAFRLSLPNLCRYADRDSMAHSVEVRMPFLDRRVAEFAFSLPTSMIFCDGVTKRTLRDSLRGLVPDPILDSRVKVGYETPQERWFNMPVARSRLAEIVLDRDARASGRYDTTVLERDFAAGAWGDVNALWRVVNVELWLASTARPLNATMQAA